MKWIVALALLIGSIQLQAQSSVKVDSAQLKQQCAATAKSTGKQCSIKVAQGHTYCKIHDLATPRCGSTTKSGTSCARTVQKTGDRCYQHKQ